MVLLHMAVASPPSGAMAVQDGPTSIRVTWTPPSPLGDTTGYRISYTGGGGSSGSVDVDGGNTSNYTLMGLTNGETYTISVVGTVAPGIPSTSVEAGTVALCKTCFYIVNQPPCGVLHSTCVCIYGVHCKLAIAMMCTAMLCLENHPSSSTSTYIRYTKLRGRTLCGDQS